MNKIFEIPLEAMGKRLDHWVDENKLMSRSQFKKIVDAGDVFLNQQQVQKAGMKLRTAGKLSFSMEENIVKPIQCPLDIVFEDDDLLIVNKPRGQLVYPVKNSHEVTLANALVAYTRLSDYAGKERPGIVHRIDKDTSGLVMVAKNNQVHEYLYDMLKNHSISREYIGIVKKECVEKKGTIQLPIAHDYLHGTRRKIDFDKGQESITHYKCVWTSKGYSLMHFKLETGRTHQIRVHMSAIGHPLVGDGLYGDEKNVFGFKGQALHACSLKFVHPISKKKIEVYGKAPDVFKSAVKRIKTT